MSTKINLLIWLNIKNGRPSASSSSTLDLFTSITHDHTPDDKDHHLTQTPGQETDYATSGQRPSSSRTPTYKGIPLTIADIVNKFPELRSFSAKKYGRTRAHILYTTCQEYEEMAKKSYKNCTISIASGVRADYSNMLERVIDHTTSKPHITATNKKKMDEAWEECTTSHPWLGALTAYNKTVLAMLLRMAVDVYSDCLIETVSARSWPMRSLACLASDHLLAAMRENGLRLPNSSPGTTMSGLPSTSCSWWMLC